MKRRAGIVLVAVAVTMIVLFFVPFIAVYHPNTARFRVAELAGDAMTWGRYSPFEFVKMLFSTDYDLRGFEFVSILSMIAICTAIVLLVAGIIFLSKKNNQCVISKE